MAISKLKRLIAKDFHRKTHQQIGQMGKQKDAKENNLVKTSIRENPAGREQSGPKKQSKLLDYM